ncbi:hypothetical protein [Caulobacter phage Cr30]|uniref:hypothetical protein n=1 Tax=Caulobacter phage Cr30 TaxID=1357714 RepID=UPI0004A9B612|nr:hypothetical protein OZ74_gp196 [Caulobacter phage Cr30]AGS81147.1 hypothetical protein [Caulobacter phage Cr30]
MKTYIGISRDHSISMQSLSKAAARDYNSNIASIKQESQNNQVDTIVSVVKCGVGSYATVEREIVNSNVNVLQPIPEHGYICNGRATPLFDSVGELITLLESVPDANDPEVAFLIMIITDGEENSSKTWNASKLSAKIQELQRTDRWSFIFRVPRGQERTLARLGIPEGNILSWDLNTRGVEVATAATNQGFKDFYTARKTGQKSTTTFYADLSNVSVNDVKTVLTDISSEIEMYPVEMKYHDIQIADFIWNVRQKDLVKGKAFYQLTKPEKEVQENKKVLIRDKVTGATYAGPSARQMLGLPTYGSVRLVPGNFKQFDVFIQSTSINRKVKSGTKVVYWENVR